MNQEDLKKAGELIDQSSSFGILLPETPDFDTLAAAEALASVLWSNPKVTGLLSPATLPADIDKTVFTKLTSPTPLLKEFIISVDTSQAPISQLRYEKPNNDTVSRVDIILTPKLVPLGKEQVSFREGTIRCDCLIAIGIPDIERLSNIRDFPPDFFTENKLINIDTGDANTRYGEANVVDTDRASRCELVWQLLACLPVGTAAKPSSPTLTADISTLLLAGILSATHGLGAPTLSADTCSAVAELLRCGGRHADAQQLVHMRTKTQPLNLLQLFARASVRSKHDEGKDILWSFLTLEDFAKTNRTADDVAAAFEYIYTTLPKSTATALLWQDPSRFDRDESGHGADPQSRAPIRVVLAGNQHMLDATIRRENTERLGPGILLRASFRSFRDAEEYVCSLIRPAL
ncbi:MAG: hypothetical protein HY007_02405 [Candidatus Sungbacteria bacterium]|nr:hypothetical protein [Candidatus Sungbacteria bacterium]